MSHFQLTEKSFKRLPLRALVGLSARCARRVQTLYQLPDDCQGREAHIQAVKRAIRIAETFAIGSTAAKNAAKTAASDSAWSASYAAENSAWPAAYAARSASYAAWTAAHAAETASWSAVYSAEDAETASWSAIFSAENAEAASWSAIWSAAWNAARSATRHMAENDFEKLLALNLGQFPNLGNPIDPSESGPLGPFWPQGVPKWFPKVR